LIKLDTTILGTILPGLPKEFGKYQPCIINVSPSEPPKVNITEEDIEIDSNIYITFLCQ